MEAVEKEKTFTKGVENSAQEVGREPQGFNPCRAEE